MPVTNYLTVKGEIIGETTGGVRTDYLTDALGSVMATVDQSASVVNTYRYKPYGELLAKTGTGSDPIFGWVGSQGYAQTGRKYAEQYVRARHYSSTSGRWTSKDPLWPDKSDYAYSLTNPVTFVDPSGQDPICSPSDPIDSSTGCYIKPRINCKGPKNPSQAYSDLEVKIRKQLGCMTDTSKGRLLTQRLSVALTCLVGAESTFNPACHSNFRKDKDPNCDLFGLFQIDRARFANCSPGNKNFCNVDIQISTATKMLTSFCDKAPDLLAALRKYWGPTKPSDGNYGSWIACMSEHRVNGNPVTIKDLQSIKCSSLSGCKKCTKPPFTQTTVDCP